MSCLVSAVMITGKDPRRNQLAIKSIISFLAQTWINKELVVINDGEPLGADHWSQPAQNGYPAVEIREIMIAYPAIHPAPPRLTLGELRNRGLQEAKGEYICQWDDDDFSHEERIERQMQLALEHPGCPVTLSHQIRVGLKNGNALVWKGMPLRDGRDCGIVGTILHPKTVIGYAAEGKHEDSHFIAKWPDVRVLNNVDHPELYIRTYSGYNTFGERHVLSYVAGPGKKAWHMPDHSKRYVQHILHQHYLGVPLPT